MGHKVGVGWVSTRDDKVQAVRNWPTPNIAQDVKSFLGLVLYYQRIVRGFSCLSAPLFSLLQKSREFVLSEECQTAFIILQKALVEAQVLSPQTLPSPLSWTYMSAMLEQGQH